MPYIKYRGVWSSGAIKEQVSYANPHAPCYEGHDKLWADARRFAETTYSDTTARDRAVEKYFVDHGYPGLQHTGGVGFIDDSALLTSISEKITAQAYQQLRSEIEKANADYRATAAETLARNNDPLRRASPEHEKLGWRTRVKVFSYTELEHHVPYLLSERSVAYLRTREYDGSGSGLSVQLVDIYHSSEGDVQQALLEGVDWAEILTDLLAMLGYGAAQIANVLGTTVPFCSIGKEFPVAVFGAIVRNSAIPVLPDQFPLVQPDQMSQLALRHVRDGLSAFLPSSAFAAFWNALERQADEEAHSKGLERMVECKNCGAKRSAGPDTKRGFAAMYTEAGLDPSLFDNHRSTRGKIQHGAKLPTAGYLTEVFQNLSQVQRTAIIATAKRAGILPGTISYLSMCWPVMVFTCRAEDAANISIRNSSFSVSATTNILPQSICGDAGRHIFFGMPNQPKVDLLSLPPIDYHAK